MKPKITLKKVLIFAFLILNIGCDQVTKSIVRQNIEYQQSIQVMDHLITLTKVENTGAFLGFGQKIPRLVYRILMIYMPLLVLLLALIYLMISNSLSTPAIIGICLIIGGGFGNITDRILFGSVTDFLHFDFIIFHTGIMNLADISITTGFIILLYEFYFKRRRLGMNTLKSENTGGEV